MTQALKVPLKHCRMCMFCVKTRLNIYSCNAFYIICRSFEELHRSFEEMVIITLSYKTKQNSFSLQTNTIMSKRKHLKYLYISAHAVNYYYLTLATFFY